MSMPGGAADGRALRRVALLLAVAFALVLVLTLAAGSPAHAAVTPDDPGDGVTIDINGVDGSPSGSIARRHVDLKRVCASRCLSCTAGFCADCR